MNPSLRPRLNESMGPSRTASVVMVGAFPPPLHGMSAVNLYMLLRLRDSSEHVISIDTAAQDLQRGLLSRLRRFPKIVGGYLELVRASSAVSSTLYMSVSGGYGQLYEILFALIGRIKGSHVVLHHHSFAYLSNYSLMMAVLARAAGRDAVHVTQSLGIAHLLAKAYKVKHCLPVSNAAFVKEPPVQKARNRCRVIGFLSNISEEKGVLEFIDLVEASQAAGLPLKAKLAGPFQDREIERKVRARLTKVRNAEYVGAIAEQDKAGFFASIDVFVFPTRYSNETEGIVNIEAMSFGVPVIAYGRGAIPEIITGLAGSVVDPKDPFVPPALLQLKCWINSEEAYTQACLAASARFRTLQADSLDSLDDLVHRLVGVSTP